MTSAHLWNFVHKLLHILYIVIMNITPFPLDPENFSVSKKKEEEKFLKSAHTPTELYIH